MSASPVATNLEHARAIARVNGGSFELTMPEEFWTVVEVSKFGRIETTCYTKAEVQSALSDISTGSLWAVWRSGNGEHGRDVSHEFSLPAHDDEAADASYARHMNFERSMRTERA